MNKGTGIGAALVATPVLALIIYLVLFQSHHQDTAQQLEITKSDLRSQKFDEKFDKAWDSLGVQTATPAGQESDKVKALEAKQATLEKQLTGEREEAADTLKQIKEAAEQAAKAQDDEIQKRLKEQSK